MNAIYEYVNSKNLTRSQQASRLIVAFSLISITMSATASSPSWVLLLALVAIYPLLTGITGWDPLFEKYNVDSHAASNAVLPNAARVELAVTGTVLIGTAFVFGDTSGVLSLLPLAGIFPALTALFGEDLLQSVTLSGDQLAHAQHRIDVAKAPTTSFEEIEAATSTTGKEPKKAA